MAFYGVVYQIPSLFLKSLRKQDNQPTEIRQDHESFVGFRQNEVGRHRFRKSLCVFSLVRGVKQFAKAKFVLAINIKWRYFVLL